nr:probable galactinol--sucrose galactosyltransferase 1 [Ipomoea batatas]
MDTNLCSLFSKPEQVLRLVLGSAFTERLYQAISPIPKMSFAKREHEFLKEIRIGPGNLGRYAKGAWKASGPTVSTLIPANNELVVEVVEASIENYEERMHACNGAAKLWMQIPTPKRGDIVRHSHLVFVRGLGFMSPFRFKMWWMTQRIETYGQDIPLETQFMIVEGHDASQFEETDEGSALHVVFLPILENDFRDVAGNWNADNELEMCLDSGNSAVEEFQQSHLVFVVARSNRERKKMPELIDTGNSDNPFDTDGSVQMQNNENVANTSSSTALLTDDLYGIGTVLNTSEQKKMMKFHLLFCFTTHTGAS